MVKKEYSELMKQKKIMFLLSFSINFFSLFLKLKSFNFKEVSAGAHCCRKPLYYYVYIILLQKGHMKFPF